MKKFHIPIGQWQKYGWKWDTAIGLGTQNVTNGRDQCYVCEAHTQTLHERDIHDGYVC